MMAPPHRSITVYHSISQHGVLVFLIGATLVACTVRCVYETWVLWDTRGRIAEQRERLAGEREARDRSIPRSSSPLVPGTEGR